ncbi:MAG: sodium-dependent transporter [Oscillospiraceae bacterium]|nr:sodium-dependent transporter [Oscillospiraceae bacterium]
MQERETFQSRLGFLLVSAGCAIGIGNVWRFPYVTGADGGGVFVLFYLLFLVIMGIPVLTMEFAVGRASRKSALPAFQALEPPGSKWHIHGWVCFAGCTLLMMYYTTVSGWMLAYFCKFVGGVFALPAQSPDAVFSNMLASPLEMTLWMAITVIGGFLVCSLGLRDGIERITKWMMVGLLCLIVSLAMRGLTLPGGLEGVKFYLLPSLERAQSVGLSHVITDAMNQAFFTLSIGIGSMEIFGSYMSDEHTLPGEAARICALDTFVALMAGLIIFPACFSFGVEPNQGPGLIFMTLPRVFADMPGGRFWGALFFLFMTFASFSTVIAVFENLVANCIDDFHWERKKSSIVCGVFMLVASMPCVLGYNLWSGLHIIGARDVLDSEDFIVSSLLLPLGSLTYLLFCVTRWGWGFDNYLKEANTGRGLKMPAFFKPYFQFVLPVLIFVILLVGLL